MKFTLNRKQFITELDFLKPNMPRALKDVSGWLNVTAAADGVRFKASRRAVFETTLQPIGEVTPGRMNIDPHVIDALARLIDDEQLHFEARKTGLGMYWSTGEALLREAPNDAPKLDNGALTSLVTLPTKAFESALKRIKAFLPYPHDSRVPGILIEAGSELRMVSFEGNAMAVVTEPAAASHPCNFFLPTAGYDRVLWAMRNNAAEEITLSFTNAIEVQCGRRIVTTPRAYGTMVPWEKLLSDSKAIRADFPVDVALEAVKRAAFADDASCGRTGLQFSPGSVTVSTSQSSESFAADFDGQPVEFHFKGNYLVGVLEAMATKRIEMRAAAPLGRVIFQPLGSTQDTFVVMPMNG